MFSFFKRNKSSTASSSSPSSQTKTSGGSNNNNEIGPTKASMNIQSAIEKQQASLQQILDQRRRSQSIEVNDRIQKTEDLHSSKFDEELLASKNRSLSLASSSAAFVSELSNKANILRTSDSCTTRSQNYDQFRDAKRRNTPIFESIVPRQTLTSLSSVSLSETYSPTVAKVASSINDEKCLTSFSSIGTHSTNYQSDEYNLVYETMGRGRNRNRHHNNRGNNNNNSGQGHNSNAQLQQQLSGVKSASEKIDESDGKVSNENCNVHKRSFSCGDDDVNENSKRIAKLQHNEYENPNKSAHADDEYSEKSASISLCENVFHDENSCSINSSTLEVKNKRDNITTSDAVNDDEEDDAVEANLSRLAMLTKNESEHGVKNYVNGEEDDGDVSDVGDEQQVNGSAPLQRSHSARRVTFAPSPTRSVESQSSEDNDETLSEDIFYEAADAPSSSSSDSSSQKMKILSTITSQSSNGMMKRIEEESHSNGISSSGSNVVSASMILSFDGNDVNRVETAFSGDKLNDVGKANQTLVKPSYMLVGDDPVALPDIVAETSQHQHHSGNLSSEEK